MLDEANFWDAQYFKPRESGSTVAVVCDEGSLEVDKETHTPKCAKLLRKGMANDPADEKAEIIECVQGFAKQCDFKIKIKNIVYNPTDKQWAVDLKFAKKDFAKKASGIRDVAFEVMAYFIDKGHMPSFVRGEKNIVTVILDSMHDAPEETTDTVVFDFIKNLSKSLTRSAVTQDAYRASIDSMLSLGKIGKNRYRKCQRYADCCDKSVEELENEFNNLYQQCERLDDEMDGSDNYWEKEQRLHQIKHEAKAQGHDIIRKHGTEEYVSDPSNESGKDGLVTHEDNLNEWKNTKPKYIHDKYIKA